MPSNNQEMHHHLKPSDVVEVINSSATSDVVLICEHASNYFPPYLNKLGLSEEASVSHAAWDPGALSVAKTISSLMNATVIAPTFSRLIYDCNRPPESLSAMPSRSEIYDVPGNVNLSAADRQARVDAYYMPYWNTLSSFIDQRIKAGRAPLVATIHSFTPIYHGQQREVELGIIHDEDSRFADALLDAGIAFNKYIFKRNDPYGPADGVTHTLIEHGLSKGLHNVMIEIKNDLLATEEAQRQMAEFLATCLKQAVNVVK